MCSGSVVRQQSTEAGSIVAQRQGYLNAASSFLTGAGNAAYTYTRRRKPLERT